MRQMQLHMVVKALAVVATWAVLVGNVANAAVIVVPSSLAALEGNENNVYPFNLGDTAVPSQRYQQVFGASEFLSLSGPHLITHVAFRPDAQVGSAFSSTLSSIQINLSTTSANPDSLSMTFADNVGVDDTVVFSGPLSLSSTFTGPPAGPKDFDIVIALQTPFLYDPAAGNLLLDVRNFSSGSTTTFDSEASVSDAVSRVATEIFTGDSVNSPIATFSDTAGLVTQFTLTSVAGVGPPTRKEDCKRGGWRTFNTPRHFRNQGDCIQFVNTGR